MGTQLPTMSDGEILTALSSGKTQDLGIRKLYDLHFGLLSQYVCNNQGSLDDAKDIFQETIIAFVSLTANGKFRGESSIKTFLFALNRNIWLNELKRRKRAVAREERFEELSADDTQLIRQSMEYKQAAIELADVLEKIGETCKMILIQFYYENRSMKEIVSSLHYENEQVVRNKKSKCLKKLQELFQKDPSLQQRLKTLLA